jgi:hypothetical protein
MIRLAPVDEYASLLYATFYTQLSPALCGEWAVAGAMISENSIPSVTLNSSFPHAFRDPAPWMCQFAAFHQLMAARTFIVSATAFSYRG